MTYSTGNIILATDYNGFVNTTAGANINATWGTASSTGGYGQTPLTTVSAAATVTATQWATLNSTISSMASHQGTSITSRTNPTAGNIISTLANVNTDITNCYTNRNNANSSGAQYTAWTGSTSKTSATGSGSSAWTLTFTSTITFANSSAYYSFFNGAGYLKVQFGKTSTGTVADTEWNTFIGSGGAGGVVGSIAITGAGASKSIAGSTYTGTTKLNGSGTPTTLTTSTGANAFTTSPTTIYKQFDSGSAYSSNYVQITAAVDSNSSPTTITLTTTWHSNGASNPGSTAQITGGTATSGISFGTSPTTLVTYYPPESTYLTNTWGTPTVAGTVS